MIKTIYFFLNHEEIEEEIISGKKYKNDDGIQNKYIENLHFEEARAYIYDANKNAWR